MNEITPIDTGPSLQVMHSVLGTGDLKELSVAQRVEYYRKTCETIGLNPLTQPFRFLTFQGQIKLYATRDCADQLRSLRKIDLTIADKQISDGLFMVTVRATSPDGRHDEDMGAVVLPPSGEARANAILRAITKAKRRVTFSICGLGFLDESEVDSMRGAKTFAPDAELPVVEIHHAEPPAATARELSFVERADAALCGEPNGSKWLSLLGRILKSCETLEQVSEIRSLQTVLDGSKAAPTAIRSIIVDNFNAAIDRLSPQPEPEAAEVAEPSGTLTFNPSFSPEPELLDQMTSEVAQITELEVLESWAKRAGKMMLDQLKTQSAKQWQAAVKMLDERRIELGG
jgi:hypothetical protein